MTPKQYYWLVCHSEGKVFLVFGSDKSEEDARNRGMELLSGVDFDIKKLPTRNQSRASALYRGVRLENTHSLKKSSQRLGHEKSITRLHRKLRRVMRFRPE